jgi:hypothetical protein
MAWMVNKSVNELCGGISNSKYELRLNDRARKCWIIKAPLQS